MAFEMSSPTTPGGWNTFFATAPTPRGPWKVLDPLTVHMPLEVEHADPTIRYVDGQDGAEQGFWYVIPARKTPVATPNGGWYFFSEIARSRDLSVWENSKGMGLTTGVGTPLLQPNSTVDQMLPSAAAPGNPADGSVDNKWVTSTMWKFLSKLRTFWSRVVDVNSSDLDLCEYQNRTIMYFNVGQQSNDNLLAVAVADMPMTAFLEAWF